MRALLDVQKLRVLAEPDEFPIESNLECDLLIVGGSMGGCAAALAACRAGRAVVLTEETDWLGGQMTSQGVSALDEHRRIESFGGSRSYYELRGLIREYYRKRTSLTPAALAEAELNPGNGWVSFLCFEPRAGVWAVTQLLAPHVDSGRLVILLRHQAVAAESDGGTVRSITFRRLDGEQHTRVRAGFFLDATETGDLLPLTVTEYALGAESARDTGEPSARTGPADPKCVQSFTYPFALEYRPGERHAVPPPETYEVDRERQPFSLRHLYHDERGWATYHMFGPGESAAGPFWTYRRLIDRENFSGAPYPHDIAMINWPGNDFRHANWLDVPPELGLAALRRAKDLSLGFCHWLQTRCPRDDGGEGYPEMMLRPDVMGTPDGLSKYPYIRESRRIRAIRTITEQDISAESNQGARAKLVSDSVGIGLYAIDIHPCEGEERIPPAAAKPFQIPLSALVPLEASNLLPACKNIGTTHITNGAYRLHPIEWNIGESAAAIALLCLERRISPQSLAADPALVRELQRGLVRSGVPLFWFPDAPLGHEAFEAAHLLAAWGVWPVDAGSLDFGPAMPAGPVETEALAKGPAWAREPLLRLTLERIRPRAPLDRASLARAALDYLTR